jgi:hypothetical protein
MLRYYIEATLSGEQTRKNWFYVDSEVINIFRELYNSTNPDIRKETYDLVNLLLRKGGSQFRALREVLK